MILAVGILLSGALATNIFAANFNKMLDARYRDIKILHNGQKINIEPAYELFIVHIDVNIIVDLDKDYSRWSALSDSQIKSYIDDINYEISRDFRDTIVEGYIYYYNNSSSYQERFKFDKDGKVDIW